jgi:hypothetical protein
MQRSRTAGASTFPWSHALPYSVLFAGLLATCATDLYTLRAQSVRDLTPAATIGSSDGNLILGAFGIAFLPGQRVLVADKLEYNIKCIRNNGRMTGSFGKRGKNDGEFQGPGSIAACGELIAVGDFESTRVQVFTDTFKHRSTFHTDGRVFDLAFDALGYLWIGMLPNARGEGLLQSDIQGNIRRSITLRHLSTNIFDNVFMLAMNGHTEIVVAYMAHNTVEIWDTSGRFVREFTVPGIRPRAGQRTVSQGLFSEAVTVPEDNIFMGVAVDAGGEIYLLADQYTEHPRRDISVIDKQGRLTARLVLPEPSYRIFLDGHGSLYSIEGARTLIRVYKLRS